MSAVMAVYENGIFRPTEPVELPEKCEVALQYQVCCSKTEVNPKSSIEGDHLSIEQKFAALAARVPAEEWAKLPADLSDQIDHYVYGTPRQ